MQNKNVVNLMYSKTIINIMIHNKEEVLSNFSSNSLLLSPDFKKFLESKLNLRHYKDSITLNFICEDILKNEEERYFNAVHETYEECYEEARYQAKKLLITSIIMFSIGVLILGLALLFEYLNKNSLLLEVCILLYRKL